MTFALAEIAIFLRVEVKIKKGGHSVGTSWAQNKKRASDNPLTH